MTQNIDTATTWRDLADQLTAEQLAMLRYFDERTLDGVAQEFVRQNEAEAALKANYDPDRESELINERLADFPLPAGEPHADEWYAVRDSDGDATRNLEWASYNLEDRRGVGADVAGTQCEDGTVSRYVYVYAADQALKASQARALARILDTAADTLDQLERAE
ncbi:hypothetical protein [Mycobacterium kyogaense]|uniref:hypothetical protein n=1 Tax=Mycobacterium kyogaense TaxID=2212479 RepID=UPI0013C3E78A|nr:hypothetical protein [Mycobacterium kyogaense]